MPSFTNDELILALISLVRAIDPTMLRQDADGFTIDFEALDRDKSLNPADESLLVKIRTAMQSADGQSDLQLNLLPSEAHRLAETLRRIETLQPWPADVLAMSRAIRARLTASPQ